MKLCDLHQLAEDTTLSLDVGKRFNGYTLLVIRNALTVQCFVNSCPHTGAPLDFPEGHFLSADKQHIQCKTHGALFSRTSGACLAGPCSGQSLRAVPVEVVNGEVFLA